MATATRTTRPVSPSVTPTPVIRSAVRVPRTPVAPPRPLQVAPPVLRLNAGLGGGMPLPVAVQAPIEQSFGADLSGVRVHSGSEAAQAARMMSARAFAYGSNIVLGGGEQATDLPLIAHEAAHTLQQRAVPTIQRFSSPHDSPHEREAHAAAHAVVQGQSFAVTQFTTPQIQRLGLSDALDYFADKANNIPGFRMFTIVLGVNPITMNRVERSPANIMRAIVEFMPGGALITQALDEYGVFDKVGRWVEEQITSLGMVGSSIKAAISQFLDSLSWSDIFNLGDVWERAKRIFTQPIDQIINFVKGLVNGILDFIKDAILKPLAKLAEGTRGWDLLIAVLGKNPITGEAVPQNAETLIGGFMKLIGQEEIWENMKKANAIGRAWTWFKTALSELLGFVQQIPALFIAAVKSLELADIVKPWNAFKKVATVFGDFIGNFISWAGKTIWKLLEIIFEVVAPAALPYLKKAQAAFRTILKAPAVFVGHLVRAGKRGFEKFATNFFEHLKTALIRWITGPLGDAGVYIPKSFSLMEIVKLVLSVLGLTWQNVRSKLVKIIPEPVLVGLEKTAGILVTLIKDGPAAAWEQIKAELTDLKDQLISQVVEMVTSEVVKAAVKKLVMMLNPAGAFVQAIIAIYNTITFFVEKIKQIAAVVGSFIDSISAIANGQTEPAANRVEQTMANTLTLVIGFLAKFAGLGDIPQKVVGVIKKIRQPIDKGLDKIVTWLGKMLDKVKGAIGGKKDDKRTPEQKNADLQRGMDEGEAMLTVAEPDLDAVHKRLPSIKNKYKLTKLELIVDSTTTDEETVHIHGEVNPEKDKPKHRVKKGGPDSVISEKDLDFSRPSFRSKTIKEVRKLHVAKGRSGAIMDGRGRFKGKKWHRRHVVPWGDMKRHYQDVFTNKLVKDASKILEKEFSGFKQERRTVVQLIKKMAKDAFNDEKNIWIGIGKENSSIQDVLDIDIADESLLSKKGNIVQAKIDSLIAEFIARHAIGGYTFKVAKSNETVIEWEVEYLE